MMPYTPGSMSANLKNEFNQAYEHMIQNGTEDELMELASLRTTMQGKPKWNSHSCRRGGAKLSRYLMEDSEASEEDINRHFGWMEEALRGGKKRQVAYASTLPVPRRVRVTSWF